MVRRFSEDTCTSESVNCKCLKELCILCVNGSVQRTDQRKGLCVCDRGFTGSQCAASKAPSPTIVPRSINRRNHFETSATEGPDQFRYMYGSISLLLLFIAVLVFLQQYFRQKLSLPRYISVSLSPATNANHHNHSTIPNRDLAAHRERAEQRAATRAAHGQSVSSTAQWAAFHQRNMQIFGRYTNSFPFFWQSFAYDPSNPRTLRRAGCVNRDENDIDVENAEVDENEEVIAESGSPELVVNEQDLMLGICSPRIPHHHPIPGIPTTMTRMLDDQRCRHFNEEVAEVHKYSTQPPPSYDVVASDPPSYNVVIKQNMLDSNMNRQPFEDYNENYLLSDPENTQVETVDRFQIQTDAL